MNEIMIVVINCCRARLSDYLGAPRSSDGHTLLARVEQLLQSHDVRVDLPEYLQSASLVFRPGKGLDFDIEFPKDEENDVTPRAGETTYYVLFP